MSTCIKAKKINCECCGKQVNITLDKERKCVECGWIADKPKLITRDFEYKDCWYKVGLEEIEDEYPEELDDRIVFYVPQGVLENLEDDDLIEYLILEGALERD
jgi:hypothetical protein